MKTLADLVDSDRYGGCVYPEELCEAAREWVEYYEKDVDECETGGCRACFETICLVGWIKYFFDLEDSDG